MVLTGISMSVEDSKAQAEILAKLKRIATCISGGGTDCSEGIIEKMEKAASEVTKGVKEIDLQKIREVVEPDLDPSDNRLFEKISEMEECERVVIKDKRDRGTRKSGEQKDEQDARGIESLADAALGHLTIAPRPGK